jgi:hypothetical protein
MSDQVFLSYSRNDRDACQAFRLSLLCAGLSVFRDEEGIRAGDRWIGVLEAALSECTAFVVLIGRDGVKRWVGAESQVAVVRHLSPHDDADRLSIFPLLLDETPADLVPPFLSVFQLSR